MAFARVVCLLVAFVAAPQVASAEGPSQLYKKGQHFEKKGDLVAAYLWYARAAAADPSNSVYRARMESVQRSALTSGRLRIRLEEDEALRTSGSQSAGQDPSPEESTPPTIPTSITPAEYEEAASFRPPVRIRPLPVRRRVEFKNTPKRLFEEVARLYGLDVVFDGQYRDGSVVTLRLEDADCASAFRALEAATSSFTLPLGEKLLLVANDTPQKRMEIEPLASVLVPLPESLAPQEAQEIARAVQSAFEIRRVAVDSARGVVLLRDRAVRLPLLQAVFEAMLHYRPQVRVEAEFLSVSSSSSLSYGLRLPAAIPFVNLAERLLFRHSPAYPSGYLNFLTFGGGKTLTGIGVVDAELFASLTRSQTETLISTQVRALSGETATVLFGERFPIASTLYLGESTGTGQVYTPPPTVQFENLGLELKITPRVHSREEVTLELEARLRVLGSTTYNTIPVIANREMRGTVRIRSGEWAVISGFSGVSRSQSGRGIPVLRLAPLLKETTSTTRQDELLIVLKPSILSAPPETSSSLALYSGTESRPAGIF